MTKEAGTVEIVRIRFLPFLNSNGTSVSLETTQRAETLPPLLPPEKLPSTFSFASHLLTKNLRNYLKGGVVILFPTYYPFMSESE